MMGRRGGRTNRRSVGGGVQPFNPLLVTSATCLCWLPDFAQNFTLNGSDVSTWVDESGQGNSWPQGTASLQPPFSATAIAGRPGIMPDGVAAQYLDGPDWSPTGLDLALTGSEMFMIGEYPTDTPGDNTMLYMYAAGGVHEVFPNVTTRKIFSHYGSTTRVDTGAPAAGTYNKPFLRNTISVSGERTVNVNGAQHFTSAVNTPGYDATSRIGAAVFVDACAISYLLVYDGKLSTPDRAYVTGGLKRRYGIA